MFYGQPIFLARQSIATLLELELSERRLHTDVYGDQEPPRRSKSQSTALTDAEAGVLFREGARERIPSEITPAANVIHRALWRSLLPWDGYKEGITILQQHLLRAVLQGIQFCVVDFLIAEMEDVITDGMGSRRSFPYAHWISYMLSRLDYDPADPHPPPQFRLLQRIRTTFPTYKASAPTPHRVPVMGPIPPVAPLDEFPPHPSASETVPDIETGEAADIEFSDGDDSSDDERPQPLPPLSHDHEAGGSGAPPPPPPSPTVTATQVATSTDITAILQVVMAQQQRSDAWFERLQR